MKPDHMTDLPAKLHQELTSLNETYALAANNAVVLHHLVIRWYQDQRPAWNQAQANSALVTADGIERAFPTWDDPVHEFMEAWAVLASSNLVTGTCYESAKSVWWCVVFGAVAWQIMVSYARRVAPPKYVLPGNPNRIDLAWQHGGTPALLELERPQPKRQATPSSSSTTQQVGFGHRAPITKEERIRKARRAQQELF